MAEDDLSEGETTQLPDPFAYVIEQIQNGQDDMAIELSLADNTGMSRGDAFELVKEVHAYLAAVTRARSLVQPGPGGRFRGNHLPIPTMGAEKIIEPKTGSVLWRLIIGLSNGGNKGVTD